MGCVAVKIWRSTVIEGRPRRCSLENYFVFCRRGNFCVGTWPNSRTLNSLSSYYFRAALMTSLFYHSRLSLMRGKLFHEIFMQPHRRVLLLPFLFCVLGKCSRVERRKRPCNKAKASPYTPPIYFFIRLKCLPSSTPSSILIWLLFRFVISSLYNNTGFNKVQPC